MEKSYDYNESNYKNKDESIKLDSVIPIDDYILDLEFNEDNLLAISNYTDNNKSGINIYEINLDDESILNVKTLNDGVFILCIIWRVCLHQRKY
ncbi:hypothetical protein Q5M85_21570 [Paraclostridium bifermentans]|nr:hypothetical protein [Paraclostridium bifermentans]